MMYELTQKFFFEAAHSLDRKIEAEASRRIHGHTYYAELTVEGVPEPKTGMLMDLGLLRTMTENARQSLDHRMLNEIDGLGPPTLENLCGFLWRHFEQQGCKPSRVAVRRDAMGDSCVLKR